MPVLTLAAAKLHLNIDAADTSDDVELGDAIDAANMVAEHYIGPADALSVVEYLRLGECGVAEALLARRPILSVESIVADGLTLDPAGFDIDPRRGIISAQSGRPLLRRTVVSYTAGNAGTVPPAAKNAAKVVLDHQWTSQRRGNTRGRFTDEDDTVTVPGLGFAVPRAAVQMLEAIPNRVDTPVSAF